MAILEKIIAPTQNNGESGLSNFQLTKDLKKRKMRYQFLVHFIYNSYWMKVMTLLLLLVHLYASAQHQERTVVIYNVALGGITSGIGDVINKPKQANWKKAFL